MLFRLRSGLGDGAEARRAPMQIEGAEGVEARMVGPVEVGRAGAQQAALLARARGEQRLLARVRDVERLDAVQAVAGEAVDDRDDLVGMVDVPERMRPDRDAAGRVDRGDRLGDRRRSAAAVGRSAGDQVGLEELAEVGEALVGDALGVVGVVERGLCEVRPADREPGGAAGI